MERSQRNQGIWKRMKSRENPKSSARQQSRSTTKRKEDNDVDSQWGGLTEIVIGIDFGTTHSGVSWTINEKGSTIRVLNDWPNPLAVNANSDKVPSRLSYDEDGNVKSWGYEVDIRDDSLSWFKILLEPHPKYPQHTEEVSKSSVLLEKMGKTAEDVVADYLACLWVYTKEDIRRRVTDDMWELNFKVRVVLTVPAVWSDIAKAKTLDAAKRAQLPKKIKLVSEPEAAALATLRSTTESNALKTGDVFVVCDAGGGTVDLISYKVLNNMPFELSECAVGDGDLCGSVFLDMYFERYIMTLVGEPEYHSTKGISRKKMLQDWERGVKRCFTGDPNRNYTVDLKGIEDNQALGIYDDIITLKPTGIQTVFDYVCGQIDVLVERQIAAVKASDLKVNAILLVGGFGESKYLHKRLEASYRETGVRVMQVNGAWSSVCRGATMWGLEDISSSSTVVTRLARGSYGCKYHCKFDSAKHLLEDRVWDEFHGHYRAQNQMSWLLRRGDGMSVGQRREHRLFNRFPLTPKTDDGLRHFSADTLTLYYCPDETPPSRLEGSVRELYKRACTLSEEKLARVSNIERGKDGKRYYICYRDSAIVLGSTTLEFLIEKDGKALGSLEASYVDE